MLNGTYNTTGHLGKSWLQIPLDSDGDKLFQVTLLNAVLETQMTVDAAPACDQDDNIKITDLKIPLLYDGVSIQFENLDQAFEAVIEGIVKFILDTQTSDLVTVLTSFLTKSMQGIMCP